MPTNAANGMTGAGALRRARLIALALIAGQVLFLGVTAALVATGAVERGPDDLSRTLAAACVLVFAVLVPVAFLLRRRLLEPAAAGGGADSPGGAPAPGGAATVPGGAPAPEAVLKAHIVFFALCEMVTLLCLVGALVQGALVPCALLALLGLGIQATNVPRSPGEDA